MERYIDNNTLFYVFEKDYQSAIIKDYEQRNSVSHFNFTFNGRDLSDLLFSKEETDLVIKAKDSNETIRFKHWDWHDLSENSHNANLLVQNHEILDVLERAATLDGEFVSAAIMGTENADVLIGGAEANIIYGQEGDDILRGLEGSDYLVGGRGSDIIDGGYGDDVIIDDTSSFYDRHHSNDWYFSNSSNDEHNVFYGGDGNDRITGGHNGHNVIYGGTGNDNITGGDGDNIIYGEEGNDVIVGGFSSDDIIYGGAGNDKIDGYNGNDIIYGGEGDDHISDGRERYEMVYQSGLGNENQLFGEAGNDTLVGGVADDYLSGGVGNDTYEVFYIHSLYRYSSPTSHRGTGNDTIDDKGNIADTDTIIFSAGLSDVLFSQKGNNLVLTDSSVETINGNQIEIIDFFTNEANKIEVFKFSDQTLTNPDFASYLSADSSASYSMSVFAPADTQAVI